MFRAYQKISIIIVSIATAALVFATLHPSDIKLLKLVGVQGFTPYNPVTTTTRVATATQRSSSSDKGIDIPHHPDCCCCYRRKTATSLSSPSSKSSFALLSTSWFTLSSTTLSSSSSFDINESQQSSSTSPQPVYGLYEVQEDMLIKRGIYEEQLMSVTKSTPLLYIPPPSLSISSPSKHWVSSQNSAAKGFGSTASSKKTKSTAAAKSSLRNNHLYTKEAEHYASILKNDGLVRIDNVIPCDIIDDVREFVLTLRNEEVTSTITNTKRTESRLAEVLLRKHRWDLKLPLGNNGTMSSGTTSPVITALYYALCQSPVAATIAQSFRSMNPNPTTSVVKTTTAKVSKTEDNVNDAILYELSCMISDYGSQRQVMHPDNPFRTTSVSMSSSNNPSTSNTTATTIPILLTCFIALQDIVNIEMGPTIFLPNTHTLYAHELFAQDTVPMNTNESKELLSPKDVLLRDSPSGIGTLTKGSCVIYDSRLLHCGSANRMKDTNRAIFYFSFRNPLIPNPGNPPSIRRDLQQKQMTLSKLQNIITQIHEDTIPNPFSY